MKIIAAFAVGLALAAMLPAAQAQAQNSRSFVSGHGLDTNACTLAAPCRTFARALTLTNPGGEISVLDTAGYGAVTINKAISIVNGGGFEAAIAVPSGGVGITIAVGTSEAVSLRGLSIDGGGVGQTGIQFNTGASLTVENCIVRHVTGDGIDLGSSTATTAFSVSNSLVDDNGGHGIFLASTGSATAVFNRVEANNNADSGIVVAGLYSAGTNTINATISDSVAAGNGQMGFYGLTQAVKAPTSVMVTHSVAANNTYGVYAQSSGAVIRLANSTVTGNANGWFVNGAGIVASYGDNYIDGNAGSTGSLTSIPRQ